MLELIVAAMVGCLLTGELRGRRRDGAVAAALIVVVACLASMLQTVSAPWWWDTWYDAAVPSIVHDVNAAQGPLLITSAAVDPEVVFANGLSAGVEIVPLDIFERDRCRRVNVSPERSTFVLGRFDSLSLQPRLQSGLSVTPVVITRDEASLAVRFRGWYDRISKHAVRSGWPTPWTTFELWRVRAHPGRAPVSVEICP